MIPSCHPIPTDRKACIKEFGKNLIKNYGKRKLYKPSMIKKSHRKDPPLILPFHVGVGSLFHPKVDNPTTGKLSVIEHSTNGTEYKNQEKKTFINSCNSFNSCSSCNSC